MTLKPPCRSAAELLPRCSNLVGLEQSGGRGDEREKVWQKEGIAPPNTQTHTHTLKSWDQSQPASSCLNTKLHLLTSTWFLLEFVFCPTVKPQHPPSLRSSMYSPLSSLIPRTAFSRRLPFFLFCHVFFFFSLNNIQKEVKAQTRAAFISSSLCSALAPRRLRLPDQAADGFSRRAAGAGPGGGSRPHSHMRRLRGLRLRSARKRGRTRCLLKVHSGSSSTEGFFFFF